MVFLHLKIMVSVSLLPFSFLERVMIQRNYFLLLISPYFLWVYGDIVSQQHIIIDFNEVDIRIYLPEKVIFIEAL